MRQIFFNRTRGGALASMTSFLTNQFGCGKLPTSVVGIKTFMPHSFAIFCRHPEAMLTVASLFQPDDVVTVDIVETEILLWLQAFHVVVPGIVDLLPDHRQQGWILLHEVLGRADVAEPLRGIHLAVDL